MNTNYSVRTAKIAGVTAVAVLIVNGLLSVKREIEEHALAKKAAKAKKGK